MDVIFYTFPKRINSTKRPTDAGLTLSCQLKEPCTVINPVIITDGGGSITDYNYVYIPSWKKYYFITETSIMTGHRYQISMTCDELASWKESIQRYSCFVERAASSYNTLIADNLLSSQENIINDVRVNTALSGDYWDAVTGCFIFRVVNSSSSTNGICTYVLSQGDITAVMGYMFNADNYSEELSDEVVKTFFNPFQYIVSVMWLPLSKSAVEGSTAENIKFGWWESTTSGSILGDSGYSLFWSDINRPSNSYSDWRAYDDRFSKYTLYLPGFGTVPINAADAQNSISISLVIDILTGAAEYRILSGTTTSDPIIASFKTNLGVDIQIGQLNSFLGGMTGGLTSTVSSMLSGNIGGVVSGLVDTVTGGLSPSPSVNGNQGARYIIRANNTFVMSLTNLGSASYPTAVAGRPLMSNVTLSSLSGFVKCGNASIDIGGYSGEKETVNNYLNSGFYME